jgi:hypothetical protein
MAVLRVDTHDGQYKEACRQVVQAFKKYIKLMGMDRWTCIVTWGTVKGGYGAEADLDHWPYYKVKFKFDLKTMSEDGGIEEYVRHELFHAMLTPLTQTARNLFKGDRAAKAALYDLEERVTHLLEYMPVWDKIETKT